MADDFPPGQTMWIAYVDTVEKVEVVSKGAGRRVLKNKVKHPYVVKDDEGEEFVIAREDLCDSPRCASLKRAELQQQYGDEEPEDEDDEDFDEDDDDD